MNSFARLENPKTGGRLFLLCWIMYAVSYLGRYNYSGVMNEMISGGLLTTTAAGTVATAYFALYGVGQLVHGAAGQRLSPFWMMLTGTSAAGCANLMMPLCGDWRLAALCWGANGFAQAMVWPATIRIIADILPEAQKEKACVHICSSVTAGTLGAYAFTVVCLRRLNWQAAFTLAGVFMLAAGAVWLRLAYPIGRTLACPIAKPKTSVADGDGVGLKTRLAPLAASGAAVLLLPILTHGMLRDGITTWLPVCLTSQFGVATDRAVVVTMLLPIINLSGAYLADWLNRRLKNEAYTAGVLFCCAVAAVLGLLWLPHSGVLGTVLLFSAVTTAMCGINTMLVTLLPVKLGQNGDSTLYSGIFNSAAYLGGAFSSLAVAAVLAFGSWNEVNLLWCAVGSISAVLCFICVKPLAQFIGKGQ
ncbi:MAG: MFS transporter [Angelakisella sp.]